MTRPQGAGAPTNVGDRLPILSRMVTQAQVDLYANAAKDFNPVHLNEEFARTTQFGRRIAHGMLTLAFVSEMLETAFPSTFAAGGELDVRFKAPVYPGETVETWGEVISVTPAGQGNLARCKAGCKKQDGTEVVTGHATVPLPLSPDDVTN